MAINPENISKYSLVIVFCLSIIIIALLLPLRIIVFNESIQISLLDKAGTPNRISNFEQVHKQIIDFLRSGKPYDIPEFTQRENDHMQDVKRLLHNLFIVLYSSVLLLTLSALLLRKQGYQSEKMKKIAKKTVIAIPFALAVLAIFSKWFSSLFYAFHLLFFKPGTFAFPISSYIKQMYPDSFFMDMMFMIILGTISLCILTLIVLKLYPLSYKKKSI